MLNTQTQLHGYDIGVLKDGVQRERSKTGLVVFQGLPGASGAKGESGDSGPQVILFRLILVSFILVIPLMTVLHILCIR